VDIGQMQDGTVITVHAKSTKPGDVWEGWASGPVTVRRGKTRLGSSLLSDLVTLDDVVAVDVSTGDTLPTPEWPEVDWKPASEVLAAIPDGDLLTISYLAEGVRVLMTGIFSVFGRGFDVGGAYFGPDVLVTGLTRHLVTPEGRN
jgi:hypothetical protein